MDNRSPNFADRMTESLIAEVRTLSSAVAEMNAEARNLRETVVGLSKIIKDGNGQASLLTRVLLLEKGFEGLDKKASEAEAALEKIDQESRVDKREQSKNKWTFYGSIVPSLLALIAAILALILK